MEKIDLFVSRDIFFEVTKYIYDNKIRHWPFLKVTRNDKEGYLVTLDKNHKVVPFLMLKFDIVPIGTDYHYD